MNPRPPPSNTIGKRVEGFDLVLLEVTHEQCGHEVGRNACDQTGQHHHIDIEGDRALSLSSFGTSNTPAPAITGVASKNENRADLLCVNPDINPPTIVAPERDMPGISARA